MWSTFGPANSELILKDTSKFGFLVVKLSA